MRSTSFRGLLPLLLLLAGGVWAGSSARPASEVSTRAAIYRQTLKGTAWIHAPDRGKGTGWVLDTSRRWLITNYHVVGENDTVEVIFPGAEDSGRIIAERSWYVENLPRLRKTGQAIEGRVRRRNRESDLALIELPSLPNGVKALPLAKEGARPGERVQVVGNRYDCESLWVGTTGHVRQLQTLREGYFSGGRQLAKGARVLVAQTPINEGDSGAALVNERGEVVGVAAAVAWEMQGAGLFMDVAAVRTLAGHATDKMVSPADKKPSAEQLAPRHIYARGLRSLALVQPAASDRHASGFLLDHARRLVLTTRAVVGKHETVEITPPVYQDGQAVAEAAYYRREDRLLRQKKQRVSGIVLAKDERRNLALLELESVPEGMEEVRLADKSSAPGDALHALSNPLRTEVLWVYTAATVRQLAHANLDQTTNGPDPAVVLLQASLGEGDGGGPVFNDNGELVGIVSGKSAPQQQISYALAVREVRDFLAESRPRWTPSTAAQLIERGILFRKARQYERALLDLNEAVRLESRNAAAHEERARVLHLLGSDERALADCDRALRLDPKLASAHATRAEVRGARGDLVGARADCDTGLRLDAHNARAFSIRGQLRLLRGDARGALADCDEAIWLDRQLPAAHLVRGQVHAHNDEHDRAIADVTQALRLDPRLAEAYRCRGDSYWSKSDVEASRNDHAEALKRNPKDALAWFGRGRALLAHGDQEHALADFTQAMRLQRGIVPKACREIERQAAALCQEENQPGRCGELLQRGLLAVQPFVKDQREVHKAITEGLERAAHERDLRERAAVLRKTMASIR
jgi:S1-C subfamily serine protease/Tfp pilus assembly protein PilF